MTGTGPEEQIRSKHWWCNKKVRELCQVEEGNRTAFFTNAFVTMWIHREKCATKASASLLSFLGEKMHRKALVNTGSRIFNWPFRG